MADINNVQKIQSALKALTSVRSSTLDTLKFLSNSFHPSATILNDNQQQQQQQNSQESDSYLREFTSLLNTLENKVRYVFFSKVVFVRFESIQSIPIVEI